MKRLLLLSTAVFWLASQSAGICAPKFGDAVNLYKSGNYSQALQDFTSIKAAYPNNALTHYYLALCHQALNHVTEAKTEYQWVSNYGDPTLKGHAAKGLAQLGTLRAQTGSVSIATASPVSSSAAGPPAAGGPTKVKKIIEFYADW